jgi:NADH-quinone oxidoreductase subunit J
MLYMLGLPTAAVIELAVCAGLVTAIFASAISLTKPDPKEGQAKEKELARAAAEQRQRLRRYLPLPALLLALALGIWLLAPVPKAGSLADIGSLLPTLRGEAPDAALPTLLAPGTPMTLWVHRAADVIGLSVLILVGVLGVAAMIHEREGE